MQESFFLWGDSDMTVIGIWWLKFWNSYLRVSLRDWRTPTFMRHTTYWGPITSPPAPSAQAFLSTASSSPFFLYSLCQHSPHWSYPHLLVRAGRSHVGWFQRAEHSAVRRDEGPWAGEQKAGPRSWAPISPPIILPRSTGRAVRGCLQVKSQRFQLYHHHDYCVAQTIWRSSRFL